MMNGRTGGGIWSIPFVGGALGVLGVLGGALYWLGNRSSTRSKPTIRREKSSRTAMSEEKSMKRSIDVAASG